MGMAPAHVRQNLSMEILLAVPSGSSVLPVRRPSPAYRTSCFLSSIMWLRRLKKSCVTYLTAISSTILLQGRMKAPCGAGRKSSAIGCSSGPDYWKPGYSNFLTRLPASITTLILLKGWRELYPNCWLYLKSGQ
jgi:hypothetical protein